MGCVNAAEEFEKLKIIEDTNFRLQRKSIYVVYLVASTCAFFACLLFPFGKNSKVRTEAWKKGIHRCL